MIRALLLVVFLAGAVPAEAAECAVPAALAPGKLALPAARAAIARTGRLMVMTIGGAATAGITAGDAMTSYPAQLRAALATALPGVVVEMVNRAAPGRAPETHRATGHNP